MKTEESELDKLVAKLQETAKRRDEASEIIDELRRRTIMANNTHSDCLRDFEEAREALNDYLAEKYG